MLVSYTMTPDSTPSPALSGQASTYHESTGDPETSPESEGDQTSTRATHSAPEPYPSLDKVIPGQIDAQIILDDTSDGGPLVIRSNDPDLTLPRKDEPDFPGIGKPEVDVPSSRSTMPEERR